MGRVVVMGSANMDICFRVPHIPLAGESMIAREKMENPGGKGANQAVAAARLGADVHMIGRVGADGYGSALLASLAGAGVDTRGVARDENASTGAAFINIADSGENNIVVDWGANGRVDEAQLMASEALIQSADWFVAQLELPIEVVEKGFALARKHGVRTILNPAPMARFSKDLLKLCDIVVPNQTEFYQLVGEKAAPDSGAARRFFEESGAGAMVITMGSQGCYLLEETGYTHFKAHSVKPVDTTGAGDCFIGALAAYLSGGAEIESAIRFANAAAAVSITRMGAQQAMPTREEVANMMGGTKG